LDHGNSPHGGQSAPRGQRSAQAEHPSVGRQELQDVGAEDMLHDIRQTQRVHQTQTQQANNDCYLSRAQEPEDDDFYEDEEEEEEEEEEEQQETIKTMPRMVQAVDPRENYRASSVIRPPPQPATQQTFPQQRTYDNDATCANRWQQQQQDANQRGVDSRRDYPVSRAVPLPHYGETDRYHREERTVAAPRRRGHDDDWTSVVMERSTDMMLSGRNQAEGDRRYPPNKKGSIVI